VLFGQFDGVITGASLTDFTYTRTFRDSLDDYTVTLPYISSSTPNGHDPMSGMAIAGFKWWNFTFPTIVDSGSTAISDFATATNGAVNFGGAVGLMKVRGESYALWNDPRAASSWSAAWACAAPRQRSAGTGCHRLQQRQLHRQSTGWRKYSSRYPQHNAGSATLVYQVDFKGGIFTISPVDISASAGQTTLTANLVPSTPVKVYGIP
jgi:hypothetical protein